MVSIIGSGNAAWVLGSALKKAGVSVDYVAARNERDGHELAGILDAEFLTLSKLAQISSSVALLAVRDDAIVEVLQKFPLNKSVLVAHVSGPASIETLSSHTGPKGVFYPLQSMKKGMSTDFTTVPMLIEGSDENAVNLLSQLASDISEDVRELDSRQRLALHAAAVWANNFVNHINSETQRITEKFQLPYDLLVPLIKKTADLAVESQSKFHQTGPAMRHDSSTMEKHLSLMDEEQAMLYKVLSESIQRRNETEL
ncbi:MAG: DUF2520 domain-containing protein [Flavobacteriia bacterium]|nr:DUF2520 domain-containing protein [Flavobacteriia bacterium]